jgi:hypothetical protein
MSTAKQGRYRYWRSDGGADHRTINGKTDVIAVQAKRRRADRARSITGAVFSGIDPLSGDRLFSANRLSVSFHRYWRRTS